jgi:hypothetical protein
LTCHDVTVQNTPLPEEDLRLLASDLSRQQIWYQPVSSSIQ